MSSRLTDLICLGLVGVVVLVTWLAVRTERDPTGDTPLPDFSLPDVSLEMALELPYRFVRFKRPPPPTLQIPADTEGALVAVREALLESATLVEDSEPLAVVTERSESTSIAPLSIH